MRTPRATTWLAAAALACLVGAGCDRGRESDSPAAQPHAQPAAQPAATQADAAWPTFQRGGRLLGQADPIPPPPMKVRWTYRVGRAGFAGSPAIAAGVAYLADGRGTLHAVRLADGRKLWTFKADNDAGFEAGPLVAGGRVFIGDMDGVFHCVRSADGRPEWKHAGDDPIRMSANLCAAGVVFADDQGRILCLAVDDGAERWHAQGGDRINGAAAVAEGPGAAPPASPRQAGAKPGRNSAGAVWFAGCDAKLRRLDAATGRETLVIDMGNLTGGAPVLDGADGVIVGTDGGRVVAFDARDGSQRWLYDEVADEAMVYSSPALAGGTAVVGARDGKVHAIDAASGRGRWTFATDGDVDASPAISAGRVYAASKDGKLYVLALDDGKLIWSFDAGRDITASPAVGEGVVLIADTGGTAWCLEPAPAAAPSPAAPPR